MFVSLSSSSKLGNNHHHTTTSESVVASVITSLFRSDHLISAELEVRGRQTNQTQILGIVYVEIIMNNNNKGIEDEMMEYVGERGAKRVRDRLETMTSDAFVQEYDKLFLGCFPDKKKKKAVKGLLDLSSCLKVSRNDVYTSVATNLKTHLLASVRNSDSYTLNDLLERSIKFLDVKELEQIPKDILKIHTTVPIVLLKRIKRERPKLFDSLPERAKSRAEDGNESREITRLIRIYIDLRSALSEALSDEDQIQEKCTRNEIDSTFRQLVSILKEIPRLANETIKSLRQAYVKSSNPVLCELRNDLLRETTKEDLAWKLYGYTRSLKNDKLVSELANRVRETYKPVQKYLDYQARKRDVSSKLKASPPVKMLLHALKDIQECDTELVFAEPPSKEIPRYYEIIDRPMDLSTIRQNIEGKQYRDVNSFARDVEQIWINCMRYNGENSVYGKYGKKFRDKCKKILKQLEQAENSRHEIERQNAISEFNKNTKMPPVPQIENLRSLSDISFALADPRFLRSVVRRAMRRACLSEQETVLSEDERVLLLFGSKARDHQKHYDSKFLHVLPPCFEIPNRSRDLTRALRILASATPYSTALSDEERALIKTFMETSLLFRVAIFRLVLIRLEEPRPNYVKYALKNYVLPFAKTKFEDCVTNFFLSEREALIEIVDIILSTLKNSDPTESVFEKNCDHVRVITEFLLQLLLMCGVQDMSTARHAHSQLSRLLLGYCEFCKGNDEQEELSRWVKRALSLWSAHHSNENGNNVMSSERTGMLYAKLKSFCVYE